MSDAYASALRIADNSDDAVEGDAVLSLLDTAVLEGDARAICARAMCYVDGKFGSVVDDEMALNLFLRIEHSLIPEAIFALAVSYDIGDLVRVNKKKAFEYYMKAAILGHQEACLQVSEFYREGVTVKTSKSLQKFWKDRSRKNEEQISPGDRVWLR